MDENNKYLLPDFTADENKCYFPNGITVEKEFISGFGAKEFWRACKGSFFMLIAALIVYILSANLQAAIVTLLVGITASAYFCRRDTSMNLSFVDQVANLICYTKSQKFFLFQFFDEWSE